MQICGDWKMSKKRSVAELEAIIAASETAGIVEQLRAEIRSVNEKALVDINAATERANIASRKLDQANAKISDLEAKLAKRAAENDSYIAY